jgi:rubredoxin
MPTHTCKHCGKPYEIQDGDVDDGSCSFECWEKLHCDKPRAVIAPIDLKELAYK